MAPPFNVAWIQVAASTLYAGRVCCCFSSLLRKVFLRELRFSEFLVKNQQVQIPIPSGKCLQLFWDTVCHRQPVTLIF